MGIFVIIIEIAYKKRKDKKVRQHDISRNAFATWRKNVEKRKLRATQGSVAEARQSRDGFLRIPLKKQSINNILAKNQNHSLIVNSTNNLAKKLVIEPEIKD